LRRRCLGGLLVAWDALPVVVVAGAAKGGWGGESRLLGQLGKGVDDCAVVGIDSTGGLHGLSVKAEGLEGVEANRGGSGLHWGGHLLDWGWSEWGWSWGSLGGWGSALAVACGVADGLDVNIGLSGDVNVDVGLGSWGKVGVLGVNHNGTGLLKGNSRATGGLVESVGKSDLGLLDLRGISNVLRSSGSGADQSKDRHEALHD